MRSHRISQGLLGLLLCLCLFAAPLCAARAVTEEDLDSAALIGETEPSGSSLCLVYSSWYMARRRVAIERGMEAALAADYGSFRLAATKSAVSAIVYWNYNWQAAADLNLRFGYVALSKQPYANDIAAMAAGDSGLMAITGGRNLNSGSVGSTDAATLALVLRHLLSSHPEGIVIHCQGSSGSTHAALITGYDEATGIFNCVDPINGGPPAPLTAKNYLAESPPTDYAKTQEGILRHVQSLWYVASGDWEKTAAYLNGDGESETLSVPEETAPEESAPEEEMEPAEVRLPDVAQYALGQFPDVSEDAWYARVVGKAYALGLMRGDEEGRFNPEGSVTLAQAIAIAARLRSAWQADGWVFDQSEGSAWYDCYLSYCVLEGTLPAGLSAAYDAPADRMSFARIFEAALPAEALAPINTIADDAIPDLKAEAPWADAVYALYRAGVLTGSEGGAFLPDQPISRAEAAAIVSRLADSAQRVRFSL